MRVNLTFLNPHCASFHRDPTGGKENKGAKNSAFSELKPRYRSLVSGGGSGG